MVTHITMLTADPAAAMLQPRSVSMVGPKLKIMAKATLKSDQIRPANSDRRQRSALRKSARRGHGSTQTAAAR